LLRLFERNTKRKTSLLDGVWKFKTDPNRQGESEKWFESFPQDSQDIVVPSCWNNELGLYHYEGIAWYHTTFKTSTQAINLNFHAVSGTAKVYVDGNYIGEHYGGFTGFNFVLKDMQLGEHSLVVYVDNTHDSLNTIPLSRVDWFHYGGITRSVELMELNSIWIKDYQIKYDLDVNSKTASLIIEAEIQALDSFSHTTQLNIFIDNELLATKILEVKDNIRISFDDISLTNVKPWDTSSPNLYYFKFDIEGDDIIERTGFRTIRTENKKIYLNEKELYLKGVNRHEEHPDWGFALPYKLMKKDMNIIKQLGCNTIRGSHYPNAKAFLDLCDQEGILFWEEIPMWGFTEEPLKNPIVLERGLMMQEEMINRDLHHPSIIIWGMHNEIDTHTEAGLELTKKFATKIRSLDNSRLLTYATMFPLDDVCYAQGDFASINRYIGWYADEIDQWGKFLNDLKEKLRSDGLEDMPIVISEYGAGGIYGDVTFESPKWTENYQEAYLDYVMKLLQEDTDIAGSYIWQYCDIRTAKEMEMGRPRSFNNKGLVNEYRKPKMAYWTVQKNFCK
jgi:beta-glucuronidase